MSEQMSFMYMSELAKEGEELRNAGMEQSTKHADEVIKDWSTRAYNLFVQYVASFRPGTQFKTEDVRVWAKNKNLIDTPPSERAWGSIAMRAKKKNLIRKIGFTEVVNPKAHRTPCALWEVI